MAVLGGIALLIFGPEQLPKLARQAGGFMREVQNTSQSFIREMERAADDADYRAAEAAAPPPPPEVEHLADPRPAFDIDRIDESPVDMDTLLGPDPEEVTADTLSAEAEPPVLHPAEHVRAEPSEFVPTQTSPEGDHPPHV